MGWSYGYEEEEEERYGEVLELFVKRVKEYGERNGYIIDLPKNFTYSFTIRVNKDLNDKIVRIVGCELINRVPRELRKITIPIYVELNPKKFTVKVGEPYHISDLLDRYSYQRLLFYMSKETKPRRVDKVVREILSYINSIVGKLEERVLKLVEEVKEALKYDIEWELTPFLTLRNREKIFLGNVAIGLNIGANPKCTGNKWKYSTDFSFESREGSVGINYLPYIREVIEAVFTIVREFEDENKNERR